MINDVLIQGRAQKLDYLRFLLALCVLLVHLIPWSNRLSIPISENILIINKLFIYVFQSSGETNPTVLAFIVLSGYCIHRNGLRKNNFDVKSFLIKRVFRISPIYFLAVLLGALAFLMSTKINVNIKEITSTSEISLSGILLKLSGVCSFFPHLFAFSFQGNGPLTTVAVEFYLYLFYPFAIYFLNSIKEKYFWYGLFLITSLGVILISISPPLKSWWHNGSFFGFLLYWYIGAKFISRKFAEKIKRNIKSIVLAWLIITTLLTFIKLEWSVLIEFRKILFTLMIGSLIHSLDKPTLNSQDSNLLPIQKYFLKPLIESSYSLYALHTPLVVICLAFRMDWYIIVPICLVAGWATYLLIEKPSIQCARSLIKRISQGSVRPGFNIT
ncbi:acyltransferase family protein [Candidatus Paracaedibacter symbiosus]|uniref:acyltransferase family protein n=1 Tax=Candidatus Paracaedibacter symbiosus TaxID=244582 RepID=UPI00050950C1|nr:acyltransferase [Candidatus Paracaedibacter symbiosus]